MYVAVAYISSLPNISKLYAFNQEASFFLLSLAPPPSKQNNIATTNNGDKNQREEQNGTNTTHKLSSRNRNSNDYIYFTSCFLLLKEIKSPNTRNRAHIIFRAELKTVMIEETPSIDKHK